MSAAVDLASRRAIATVLMLCIAGGGLAALASVAAAQDGAPDPNHLPEPFATPIGVRRSQVVGWPATGAPVAPPSFSVSAYARGLTAPRRMLVLPNGDMLVSESRAGRVTLLRDAAHEGRASVSLALIEGLKRPFGLALYRDRLYVAATNELLSCPFLVGQTRLSGACRHVADLPAEEPNNHWTRDVVVSPDERSLYVSVGSATNVDEEHVDEHDPLRAAILFGRPDGHELSIYASGLRNPVALAFEPSTGALWTTVNERDLLGDELVPDYMTAVRRGAFYGWPYSYIGSHVDPRHPGEHPELVRQAVVPDFLFQSHAATLGLAFYQRAQFPSHYRGGVFVAEHGSWNRSTLAGYKVVYVPFAAGRPSGPAEDFLTGFIKSEESAEVFGRPVGVAVANDGALLIADDGGNTIWRVTFHCPACTPDPVLPPRRAAGGKP